MAHVYNVRLNRNPKIIKKRLRFMGVAIKKRTVKRLGRVRVPHKILKMMTMICRVIAKKMLRWRTTTALAAPIIKIVTQSVTRKRF